ncbi:hypothetical protein LCGC14_3034050, partial [marine sediment metagenome]
LVRGSVQGRADAAAAWVPVALFVVSAALSDATDATARLRQLYEGHLPEDLRARLEGAPPAAATNNVFTYRSPVAGTVVEIPARYMQHSTMLSGEVRAMLQMGKRSLEALREVFAVINHQAHYTGPPLRMRPEQVPARRADLCRKLLGFIESFSLSAGNTAAELRSLVRAIALRQQDAADVFSVIDDLYLTEHPTDREKNAMSVRIEELLHTRPATSASDDPELDVDAAAPRAFAYDATASAAFASGGDVRDKMDAVLERAANVQSLRHGYGAVDGQQQAAFSLVPDRLEAWLGAALRADAPGNVATQHAAAVNAVRAAASELMAGFGDNIRPVDDTHNRFGDDGDNAFGIEDDADAVL